MEKGKINVKMVLCKVQGGYFGLVTAVPLYKGCLCSELEPGEAKNILSTGLHGFTQFLLSDRLKLVKV